MIELLRPYVDGIVNPIRESISRAVTSAVELLLAGLLGLVCLGFLVAALEIWLAERYGPLAATLILAGVFFALALIVLLIRLAGDSAARSRAEKVARERAEERRRSAVSTRSIVTTIANLAPLLPLLRRRRDDAPARAAEAAEQAEAGARRMVHDREAEVQRAAALVSDRARAATRSSRKAVREGMGTFGPWTVIAVATMGGVVTSMAWRRMRRR
ncbi:MAG: hypothetical protein U1E62_23400 [Alsobacter sp.]